MTVKKRGYSRDFTPDRRSSRYLLDKIPRALWLDVRKYCRREGISVRSLLLSLVTTWVAERKNTAGK